MKFLLYLLVILLLLIGAAFTITKLIKNKIITDLNAPVTSSISQTNSPTSVPAQPRKAERSLFVPYWTVPSDLSKENYDYLIYFGIATGESGINREEPGYRNLGKFQEAAKSSKTLLTLRMVNSAQSFEVIEDMKLRKKVIDETLTLQKQYGFDGIVLNLEVSALPLPAVLKSISTFIEEFYREAKGNKRYFAVTMYGDTFYRLRPFDMAKIAKSTDQVMIMAYDFHKARGTPGPNFPFEGKEVYGYDMHEMITGFLSFFPPEKITVISGLYGYDWTVDDKGEIVGTAKPLTLFQTTDRFVTSCEFQDCKVKRDEKSSEMKAEYIEAGQKHVVWFEDHESVEKKQKFLKTKGISSFAYWAYTYF